MKRFALATLLTASLALPVAADPNPQLVASLENRLSHYGLSADLSQFATSTVAALHLTLVQSGGYFEKRRKLRTILRNAKYK